MDSDAVSHSNPVHRTHSSSSYAYLARQPTRTGFLNGNFGEGCLGQEEFNCRLELREEVKRELEKEKIRAEILAEENERKRQLKEEVLNELMIERRMATRNVGGFPSPFTHNHDALLEQRNLHRQSIGSKEGITSSLEGNYGHQRQIVNFQVSSSSVIPSPLPDTSRNEVFFLGNHNGGSLSATKRKATPPISAVEGSSEPCAESSKKKVEEWSCAICEVSATSECSFKEHIQGKKHLTKEKALIAEKTGAHFGLGVPPKKTIAKPIKLALTTVELGSSNKKRSKARNEAVNQAAVETIIISNLSDPNGAKEVNEMTGENKRGNFKYWCEMCRVGTFSEKVMNIHRQGKKHKHHQKGKTEAEKNASETNKAVVVAKEKPVTETKKSMIVEMVNDIAYVNLTGQEVETAVEVDEDEVNTAEDEMEDVTA